MAQCSTEISTCQCLRLAIAALRPHAGNGWLSRRGLVHGSPGPAGACSPSRIEPLARPTGRTARMPGTVIVRHIARPVRPPRHGAVPRTRLQPGLDLERVNFPASPCAQTGRVIVRPSGCWVTRISCRMSPRAPIRAPVVSWGLCTVGAISPRHVGDGARPFIVCRTAFADDAAELQLVDGEGHPRRHRRAAWPLAVPRFRGLPRRACLRIAHARFIQLRGRPVRRQLQILPSPTRQRTCHGARSAARCCWLPTAQPFGRSKSSRRHRRRAGPSRHARAGCRTARRPAGVRMR